jgi:hypothetical protein
MILPYTLQLRNKTQSGWQRDMSTSDALSAADAESLFVIERDAFFVELQIIGRLCYNARTDEKP